MRALTPHIEKTCQDCPTVFLGHPKQRFCADCQVRRIKVSNRKSHQVSDYERVYTELSEAHIDKIFASALAEIRRTKAHRIEEPSWDYRGRYREP